eukprot:7364507-Pyramimonas_sp.AAC.1
MCKGRLVLSKCGVHLKTSDFVRDLISWERLAGRFLHLRLVGSVLTHFERSTKWRGGSGVSLTYVAVLPSTWARCEP